MNQIDEKETILSEDAEGHSDDTGENLKLVPVAESIRYRRRAQSAEKKVEVLTKALTQAESQAGKMQKQLNDIQVERELVSKLSAAGAVDLETAVLIAKARMETAPASSDEDRNGGADLDGVIEQLKKEKHYLFDNSDRGTRAAKKTAGAKERIQNREVILERAAKKAARTGNRADLQEYLKLRRNFM
jgi:hypothetical protein